MATRAYIAHTLPDRYEGIYVHWDGYPEYTGQILLNHYPSAADAARLIAQGNLTVLEPIIPAARDASSSHRLAPTTRRRCTRSSARSGPSCFTTRAALKAYAEECGVEFLYLHDGAIWLVAYRGPQFFGLSDGAALTDFVDLEALVRPNPLSGAIT